MEAQNLVASERKASRNAKKAYENAKTATQKARDYRLILAHTCEATAKELLQKDDMIGALPWIAKAAKTDDDPHSSRLADLKKRLEIFRRQMPGLSQVYKDRTRMRRFAFSPNGKQIATAGGDGMVRLWDVENGLPVRVLKQGGQINFVAFSPDGKSILAAGSDTEEYTRSLSQITGSVVMWNAADGRKRFSLSPNGLIQSARFDLGGTRIVTAGGDGARVWNANTGKPITDWLKHDDGLKRDAANRSNGEIVAEPTTASPGATGTSGEAASPNSVKPRVQNAVTFAAFDRSGTRVVTAGEDGTARVWNAASGKLLCPPIPPGGKGAVTCADFSSDGQHIAAATEDGTAGIFSASGDASDKPIGLTGHTDAITSIQFSPDGQSVLTASRDATARIWNAHTGKETTPSLKQPGPIDYAEFSADGKRVVTADGVSLVERSGDSGEARVWDTVTGVPVTPPLHHSNGRVLFAAFRPGDTRGQWVATACADGVVRLWDTEHTRDTASATNTVTGREVLPHKSGIYCVRFAPKDDRIVTASSNTATIWAGNPLLPILSLRGHSKDIYFAVFSPDGSHVLTVSTDKTARIWDAEQGRTIHTFPLTSETVYSGAWSPDGQKVALSSIKDAVIFDARTGKPLSTHSLPDRVNSVDFSPDGNLSVAACSDGSAYLWDVTSDKIVRTFAHRGKLPCAVFSPNGKSLVTGDLNGVLKSWDVRTGKLLWLAQRSNPLYDKNPIYEAAFSPDGRLIAAACGDGTLRIWNASTGQPYLLPLKKVSTGRESDFASVAFSHDGKQLVTASISVAQVWKVSDIMRAASAPTPRGPEDDSRSFAQRVAEEAPLMAHQSVSQYGDLLPAVDAGALRIHWNALHPNTLPSFQSAREQTMAWHGAEAARLEVSGKWAAAIEHLDWLIAKNPADATLRRQRDFAREGLRRMEAEDNVINGGLFVRKQDWPPAIQAYTDAIAVDGTRAEWYKERAQAYFGAKQYSKAIEDDTKALTLTPNDVELLIHRGSMHTWINADWQAAIKDYDAALRIEPENADALRRRAEADVYFKEYDTALARLKQILDKTDDAQAYKIRADVYRETGRHQEAIADYTKWIALAAEDATIADNRERADTLRCRADEYMEMGKFVEARDDLSAAEKSDPSYINALYRQILADLYANESTQRYRRDCYRFLDRLDNAALTPDDFMPLIRAYLLLPDTLDDATLASLTGRVEKLISDGAQPKLAAYDLRTLGLLHYRAGHYEAALRSLTSALSVIPADDKGARYLRPETDLLLAMAQFQRHHTAEAAALLRTGQSEMDDLLKPGGAPIPWYVKQELKTFRAEAEALLQTPAVR